MSLRSHHDDQPFNGNDDHDAATATNSVPVLGGVRPAATGAELLQLVRPDAASIYRQMMRLGLEREAALEAQLAEVTADRDAWQRVASAAIHELARLETRRRRRVAQDPPVTPP